MGSGSKKDGVDDSPGMDQAVWRENSLLKLYARHTSPQSLLTFSNPRSKVCLYPITCLMIPKTGSTVCLRFA